MIAPIAISTDSSLPPPLSSATTGMIDSGSAVPTAASSAPTAPCAEVEPVPEPLDGVGEADRAAHDEHERGEQLEGDHAPSLPTRGRVLRPAPARPRARRSGPENRQPPRNVPSSAR